MNPLRLSVAFRLAEPATDLSAAIDAFHRFIQRGSVEGLVLDVADYRHVPQGPGVLLIGHDVDYALTDAGLTVTRKRSQHDDTATQLLDVLRMGLVIEAALRQDPSIDVTVDPFRFSVTAHDRTIDAQVLASGLADAVKSAVDTAFDGGATITPESSDDPRTPPSVAVVADGLSADEVLARLGGSRAPGQSPWDIPVEELVRLRESDEDFVLVDVREDSEYEIVNLGGSLIPLGELSDRLGELDKDRKVVVHCRSGVRGADAVTTLREAGFGDAWNVNGALVAWRERVDPSVPLY